MPHALGRASLLDDVPPNRSEYHDGSVLVRNCSLYSAAVHLNVRDRAVHESVRSLPSRHLSGGCWCLPTELWSVSHANCHSCLMVSSRAALCPSRGARAVGARLRP